MRKKTIYKMTIKDENLDIKVDRPNELPWWKLLELLNHSIIKGLSDETGIAYDEIPLMLNLSKKLNLSVDEIIRRGLESVLEDDDY